jgi:5-methylthioribose kinase
MSRPSAPEDVLDETTGGAYLVERGIFGPHEDLQVTALSGGVSNVVLLARAPGRRVVLKQSLGQLRVADTWLAARDRVVTEARALVTARAITPEAVPEVLDSDPDAYTVTIACAPDGWREWRGQLLEGAVDPTVGARLGAVLAAWHAGTTTSTGPDERAAFDQLRADPFYRTVMDRDPAARRAVGAHLEQLLATSLCTVHGDYSPKNVLVGPDRLWVVDFEVSHRGDPSFDVAFLLCHLFLKAIHLPSSRHALRACAEAFWSAYYGALPPRLAAPPDYVLGHLGCLLLARVSGKSPAAYLEAGQAERARHLGLQLVLDPPRSLRDAWSGLHEGNEP